uniref:Cleavage and polyadenylation specificity factor subunit 4 n=1 Tax=Plectus sambesii TaxID=2011161 RepID=A0A914W6W8_9BILA
MGTLAALTMQDMVANVDNLVFDVEMALESQLGAQRLPFPGMDKSGAGVCVYFMSGGCELGQLCPYRHVAGDKSVVCKHWLRGLCKKGDQCEFLHEYDLSKMPECYFFSKYSACSNKECPFRHIDPESKIKDCQWYDRGFCRHGPHCKSRHRRRVICRSYLNGLCPEGPNCKFYHPSFDIPTPDPMQQQRRFYNLSIICHNCHERGHKATYCPHLPTGGIAGGGDRPQAASMHMGGAAQFGNRTPMAAAGGGGPLEKKPLSEVTCYKCGEKGHYANKCSKGALAFLSSSAHLTQEIRERDEQSRLNKPPPPAQVYGARPRPGEMVR